jgi:hypothetical protein
MKSSSDYSIIKDLPHITASEMLLTIIGVTVMSKLKVYIRKSLGFALIFWYATWIGTVISLIFGLRPCQPDLPFIFVSVDIGTCAYFTQLLLTKKPKTGIIYKSLITFLGAWFFGFTYVDLMVSPLKQPNSKLWHISMLILCLTTLISIIYAEFKLAKKEG